MLAPTSAAYQDLSALLANQAGVAQRWHDHLLASPFGTIHAATFSFPSPIGTTVPHPPVYALANFDPLDMTKPIATEPLGDGSAPLQFPKVNRRAKHKLVPRAPARADAAIASCFEYRFAGPGRKRPRAAAKF